MNHIWKVKLITEARLSWISTEMKKSLYDTEEA